MSLILEKKKKKNERNARAERNPAYRIHVSRCLCFDDAVSVYDDDAVLVPPMHLVAAKLFATMTAKGRKVEIRATNPRNESP